MSAELYRARSAEYTIFADAFLSIPTLESARYMQTVLSCGAKSDTSAVLTDDELEKIAVDRTQLMRGLTPDGPTPPYQSAFSDASTQSVLEELLRFYTRNSYVLSKDAHEAPDYLGVELAFASKLCSNVADLYDATANDEEIENTKAALDEFLARFLGPLTLKYAAVMKSRAKTKYYRQFAGLLEEFMQDELEQTD